MSYLEKIEKPKLKKTRRESNSELTGVWKKCQNCKEILNVDELIDNLDVCPSCNYHFRFSVESRIESILDADSFQIFSEVFTSEDPLGFVDKATYKERIKSSREAGKGNESVIAGKGKIEGKDVAIAFMNFRFMGGSMGVACGEMIAKTMELALEENIPCIIFSSSGGARMQEGILSLMQMGKTSAVRSQLREKSIPYISVLTDPTTGGCAASFAMLGDVNIAEPNCLIGFAGPRVIEQTIRQKLPNGFQRSEFLQNKGFIDRVVDRKFLKKELNFFLEMFSS